MDLGKPEPQKVIHGRSRRESEARLALFVRCVWPKMMEAEPPKTEPTEPAEIVALRDTWRNDLGASGQIVNPYIPLAHRK